MARKTGISFHHRPQIGKHTIAMPAERDVPRADGPAPIPAWATGPGSRPHPNARAESPTHPLAEQDQAAETYESGLQPFGINAMPSSWGVAPGWDDGAPSARGEVTKLLCTHPSPQQLLSQNEMIHLTALLSVIGFIITLVT